MPKVVSKDKLNMPNHLNRQARFSASLLVMALVAVLGIAGVGITIFKKSSDTKTATAPTESPSNPLQPSDLPPAEPAEPATA
jgi:hypothetical protein